jgi:hypothetical protein
MKRHAKAAREAVQQSHALESGTPSPAALPLTDRASLPLR